MKFKKGTANNPVTEHPELTERLNQWLEGLITDSEFDGFMDSLNIRGSFDHNNCEFTGYDYKSQSWIVIS